MIFEVKSPVLGFEDAVRFEFERVDDNFATLRNENSEVPAFTVINPYVLREYSFDIPAHIKSLMEIEPSTKLLVYCIMVLQRPFSDSFVNFLAPLIFNVDNLTMAQVVLDEKEYPHYGSMENVALYISEE